MSNCGAVIKDVHHVCSGRDWTCPQQRDGKSSARWRFTSSPSPVSSGHSTCWLTAPQRRYPTATWTGPSGPSWSWWPLASLGGWCSCMYSARCTFSSYCAGARTTRSYALRMCLRQRSSALMLWPRSRPRWRREEASQILWPCKRLSRFDFSADLNLISSRGCLICQCGSSLCVCVCVSVCMWECVCVASSGYPVSRRKVTKWITQSKVSFQKQDWRKFENTMTAIQKTKNKQEQNKKKKKKHRGKKHCDWTVCSKRCFGMICIYVYI